MSWQDRRYSDEDNPMRRFGRPGGDWQGLRPSFDNPLTWAVSLGRIAGIDVRIHILFLLFIVVYLIRSLVQTDDGPPVTVPIVALSLAFLFLIVLLHEFGHCIACRYAGGEANEILMWPLGGLAFTQPPHNWKAHFITVAGGPAVNVIICLVTGLTLGLMSGHWLGVAIPNPLGRGIPYEISHSWILMALYLINLISMILLLFNLAPMFPLDGGRIVQSLLWRRMGYVPAMRIAIRTGFIGAIVLGVFGAVIGRYMIVGIAIFGGITCWITHKQMEFTEQVMGGEDYALGAEDDDVAEARPTRQQRREAKQAAREAEEAQQVDQILQKIARTGMDSLSRRERQLLKRVTERKRQQS